ncbi:MAG: response regulator transcription factor [Anaerolineae bacterium]|nr:response regulator transcription factor [Anaerolineae bacterium]
MERQPRILVVDDEPSVCVALEAVLVREGYEVLTAHSGAEALQILTEVSPIDLALLDLNMPGMDGLQLMSKIKTRWPDTVLMILTGYGTLESALLALRYGAHDYLLKPSSPADIKESVRKGLDKLRDKLRRKQLLTRIESDVRALTEDTGEIESVSPITADAEPKPVLRIGGLVIDIYKHAVTLEGQLINLTPTEFDTLVALARKTGRVMSCAELVKEVQGYECDEREARGVIKTHISHLRQKLEPDPANPRYLVNVRGVGYMLTAP